ncbi:MAG: transglycosylase SLT domain-containing protein [Bacteroidales bacterium]|nr:transglycosylase SLT domain-containing protein [Bacteroidales bacterium]
MKNGSRILPFILLTAAALLLTPSAPTIEGEDPEINHVLRCVIFPDRHYTLNKALIQKFADDISVDAQMVRMDPHGNYLDSLRLGSVDLIILKYNDSLERDGGLIASRLFMDSTAWLARSTRPYNMITVNMWINDLEGSSYYDHTRRSLMKGRGGTKSISPYDYLVKKNAARIGWDWILVSAIIATESNFRVGAKSSAGATGLMQVLPGEYSADTLWDPAVNIAVGTYKLYKYERTYKELGADSTDRVKMTLAAYNGGQGRMQKVIEYAIANDIDPSKWDNIAELLPKVTYHAGEQMVYYVDRVLAKYGEFQIIYND